MSQALKIEIKIGMSILDFITSQILVLLRNDYNQLVGSCDKTTLVILFAFCKQLKASNYGVAFSLWFFLYCSLTLDSAGFHLLKQKAAYAQNSCFNLNEKEVRTSQ